MKRILTSAVALALLIGAPALAQDRDGKQDRGAARPDKAAKPNRPAQGARPNPGARPGGDRNQNRPGDGANRPGQGGPGPSRPNPSTRPTPKPNPGANRPGNGRPDHNRPGVTPPNNNRPGNPNWNRPNPSRPNVNRPRPKNFDRRAYQRNVKALHRYRAGAWRRPPGWTYRRWSYGQILPSMFFAQNYWLNDYYSYSLPVPPYGYEWVRYGDDAILVDVNSGSILQVMYGVFY